jgi:hypothetical protein
MKAFCFSIGLAIALPCEAGTVLNLVPGSHLTPIGRVTYKIGNATVTQTAEPTGVISVGDGAVSVIGVRTAGASATDLVFFNTDQSLVRNLNPQFASINGVGVFDNGVIHTSVSDLDGYARAYARTTEDTDLRHFAFHDLLNPAPPTSGVPDLDLIFRYALMPDDFLLVGERWGNSSVLVTALAADGAPYAGANQLRVGGAGGSFGGAYQYYDWNTGYAAASNVPSQAMALSLFSVAKFFENTNLSPGPVFGLRIDNDDEADLKWIPISGNPFTDNPEVLPEPSVWLMTVAGTLLAAMRRKRTR